MKRLLYFVFAVAALALGACSHSDLYDDMPSQIQSFISQYYPNSILESFTSSGTSYTVVIKNGPTMTFDQQCKWTRVNGNGSTLPQVLLFNDLPPALYEYLQETENTNSVFLVMRDKSRYVVELLKDTLTYDIGTGEITGEETSPTGQQPSLS